MPRLSSSPALNERPYFLWDESRTLAEYEHDLRTANAVDWAYEIAKVMREGRDADVWRFTTPQLVAARFDAIAPLLGRRRAFWEYLLDGWRRDGFLLAPQLHPKIFFDGVRCDSVEEILVNKLCALVGRSEIRDLVDLMWLERSGYRIEDYVDAAAKKDGGFSPATAAWLLSGLRVRAERVPPSTNVDDLDRFRASLETRFRALTFPSTDRA